MDLQASSSHMNCFVPRLTAWPCTSSHSRLLSADTALAGRGHGTLLAAERASAAGRLPRGWEAPPE